VEFDMRLFGDDYLYFAQDTLTDELSDAQAEAIWTLLELEPGMDVLDLACGHGRIANRLAARGARLTGLDATPLFLEIARKDARARGVDVEYVEGDMRAIPWRGRFDRIVNWFTAFGYFEDDDNRRVLAGAEAALRPGGRLLIETANLLRILTMFRPAEVAERDGNLMIDTREIEAATGRIVSTRIVVRDGEIRRYPFFVRSFTFTELRDWLLAAGFERVGGYGSDGSAFTHESRRMLVVARKRA
jgi:2-polyprenyl-3-methyl-5-hydroxy-6-metoxy-1,4-benzoquinol methylase